MFRHRTAPTLLLMVLGTTACSQTAGSDKAPGDTAGGDDGTSADSGGSDSGTPDTADVAHSLPIGEVPPDFTLIDTNPTSTTHEQPVTVSDKTGFVTGWYFFKAS